MKRFVIASLIAAALSAGFAADVAADPPTSPQTSATPTPNPPPAAVPLAKGKLPKTKSARQHLTSGVVKAYDAKTRTLTLDTGSKYVLGDEVVDAQFSPGDTLLLHWAMTNGQRLVAKAALKK